MKAFIHGVHTFTSKVEMLRDKNERYRKDLGGVKKVLELTKVANSLLQTKYVALKREMEREKRKMKFSLNAMTTETEHLKDQLNATLFELDLSQQNNKQVLDYKFFLENDLKASKENNRKLEIELANHNNGHKIEQNQLSEQDDIQSLPTASDQPPVEENKKSVLVDLREKIRRLNAECDFLRQERDEYREKWKNVAQAKAAIIEID